MALPAGWGQTGNVDEYEVRLSNQTFIDKDGKKGKSTLLVVTNKRSGDFKVYENNTDSKNFIYENVTDPGSSGQQLEIENLERYNAFFTRDTLSAIRNTNLQKDVKANTIMIAEDTAKNQVDKKALEELLEQPRYKSSPNAANSANPDPVVPDPDTPLPVVDTDNTGDTNSALPPEDGQTSTPLTENDLRDNVKGRREGTFGENVSLQYPIYIPKGLKYDHIQISPYAYVPAGLGLKPTAAEDRYKNVEKLLGTVTLPMQPNFSESNSVDWGGDMLNAVQSTFANAAMGAITDLSSLKIIEAAKGILDEGLTIADAFGSEGQQFLAAYFAGQAVKANITGRTTGAVINPNLELLFNGPKLRTFSFSFKLTPRSADEAIMVRKIIKFFKKNMAAQRSTSNLFLLSPNVFKLKYISGFNKEQNPYMNKIKPCALSSFNVNYTPDGSYMTYNDPNNPSMTSYDIGLSFSEIEPIYADEIDYATNDMSY